MKLLLDMNLSPLWIEVFRDAGFQAVHWSSLGTADAADEEILRFSRMRTGWCC